MSIVHDLLEKRRAFVAGRISRRRFAAALASVGIVTATVLARPSPAEAGEATVFTWSEYEGEGYVADYAAKHGRPPEFAFFVNEEEAFAKLRSGFRTDVVTPCTYKVPPWHRAGLLDAIDVSRLSNWGDVVPGLRDIPGTVIDGQRYFVPRDYGFTAITFRHDLAPEYLEEENASWGILWDEAYAGRLSMIDSLIDGVAVASIYAGLNPFDLAPEGIEETRRLLAGQLPLLRCYATDMADVERSLASGELVAAATYNGSPTRLKRAGVPVTYMKPTAPALNGRPQGPMVWVCGLCLSANGDPAMRDKAYDVLDSYLSAEAGVWEVTETGMGHSNSRVYELLDESLLAERGLGKDPDLVLSHGIFQSEMKQESALQAMFEEVKEGM